jgi:hypothetical protein
MAYILFCKYLTMNGIKTWVLDDVELTAIFSTGFAACIVSAPD